MQPAHGLTMEHLAHPFRLIASGSGGRLSVTLILMLLHVTPCICLEGKHIHGRLKSMHVITPRQVTFILHVMVLLSPQVLRIAICRLPYESTTLWNDT